jgi:hypothetical protein
VRIPYANIPTHQASRISTASPAASASKSVARPQLLEPQDRYTRAGTRPSAQVIDAEYVEFYTPSSQVFQKERQNLDLSLEADAPRGEAKSPAAPGENPALANYRAMTAEVPPPPGSFINIFA